MPFNTEMDIINRYYMYNRVANSDGFADSLDDLKSHLDIRIQEYRPGTRISHWEVPPRWHLEHATLCDETGTLIWDAGQHPLGVWAYSQSFSGRLEKADLLKHLFSNPAQPDHIPFRFHMMFRHWEKDWGLSLPYTLVKGLDAEFYDINIKTRFTKDPMLTFTYEAKGKSRDTILIVGHWCHPGQANDGLSGSAVGIKLIDELKHCDHHYTYRFLGVPELIGSMAYLNLQKEEKTLARIKAVIGLNFLGHDDTLLFFKSVRSRSRLDNYLQQALKDAGSPFQALNFKELVEIKDKNQAPGTPPQFMGGGTGDEAPFEAPGFSIPTSALTRKTPYPEYHTDADSPALLSQKNLEEIRKVLVSAVHLAETDWIPTPLFDGVPCLSHPDLNLFKRPLMESNMPRETSEPISQINYHQLTTYIIYDFDMGLSVFELATKYNIPFEDLDAYLGLWEKNGLLSRTRCPFVKSNPSAGPV